MEITAALQDYFNCHHCPTSLTLRSEVAERLFNVLTPATVNTLYTIRTVIGERRISPLQVVTQVEDVMFATRLIVDLGADLLFSAWTAVRLPGSARSLTEGDGIPPLRSLLRTYSSICFFTFLHHELVHPVSRDAVLSALTAGVERVTDIPRLMEDIRIATRQSGLTQEDGAGLALILRPSIQTAMRSVAWSRRRHLIAVYHKEEEKWNQLQESF